MGVFIGSIHFKSCSVFLCNEEKSKISYISFYGIPLAITYSTFHACYNLTYTNTIDLSSICIFFNEH